MSDSGASGLERRRRRRRVHTPTVIQMESVECGAASLGIVLGYFGRYVRLEELREVCEVSRDGSNAGKIVAGARRYGLQGKGFRRGADEVLEGPFPAIVFWKNNHFLVVEGADEKRAFLNDPANGHRSVPRSEFDECYSGIVLTCETTDAFEPGGDPPKPFARLTDYVARYRSPLAFALAVGGLLSVVGFVVPGLSAVFVDRVLIDGLERWLTPIMAAMAAAIVLQAALAWVKEQALLRIRTSLSLRGSADFVWKLLRLPASFFDQRYVGDVGSRVLSIQRIAHLVGYEVGGAMVGAFTAIVLLLLITLLDPKLAAIAFVGVSLNWILIRAVHGLRAEAAIRLQANRGKLVATSVIGLRTIETLKAIGGEDDFFARWAGEHARSVNSEQAFAQLDRTTAVAPTLIATLTVATALVVGGRDVMAGTLALGTLLAFQVLFASIAASADDIVDASASAQEIEADIARLEDVERAPEDQRHRQLESGPAALPPGRVGLRLEGVSFGYSPHSPPLIEDLSFEVEPGGWVALVGASGSGKSTIAKLIGGLYAPWSGKIELAGQPIESLDRHQLAHLLATVDQNIALFAGTVRDNITLWDDAVPHEDVVEAAREAQILDDIVTLPGSFDALIEEGGRNISGGQRQRLEIARALVRPSQVLVLDEATSALDPVTEVAIMDAVRRRGVTCIVVAHRLSTVRDCDEILVLDRGHVVERGRHDELMARKGEYARLVSEGGGH